jgi:hypothetical protein
VSPSKDVSGDRGNLERLETSKRFCNSHAPADHSTHPQGHNNQGWQTHEILLTSNPHIDVRKRLQSQHESTIRNAFQKFKPQV